MDKEWMHLPSRLVPEYEEGVQKFIAQARNYAKTREVILCPCKRCKNKKYLKFDQVYDHLIIKGIDPSYTIWFFHGESYISQSQDKGRSKRVQKESESREAYHLSKDVFVPEEEKEIQECPPESQNTINIVDDASSLVFGEEAQGRLCGMGFGVSPSKVEASVQPNGTVKQLQTIVHNLQQEMQEMRFMFLKNMRQQNQQEQIASGGIGSGVGNEIGSNSDINIDGKKLSILIILTNI